MQYKTIILELLEQRPTLHDQLRRERKLLTILDSFAQELKTRHEAWKVNLSTTPGIDPGQIPSAALEMALQEMESRLRRAFPPDDPEALSPNDLAHILQHTPRD